MNRRSLLVAISSLLLLMLAMSGAVLAQDEMSGDVYEGDFTFAIPEGWEVTEGIDLVKLTRDEASLTVAGPTNYTTVIGDMLFTTDAEYLTFYLDRSGYTPGESIETDIDALATVIVELPRRDQSGFAYLVDLDNGRQGVVISLSTEAVDLALDEATATVVGSYMFPPTVDDIAAGMTADDVYEGDYSFAYSNLFALEEGTDIVRLTYEGATIVVSGPDNYGLVLSSSTFDTAAEELGFVMDRLGYTVGDTLENTLDNALATVAVELPRRDQSGTATLLDLGFGRVGVVTAVATDEFAPIAQAGGDIVAESLDYPPTIVDIAASDENFTTLVAAADAAGLVGTLSGGEYTVFAPTDEAFAAALDMLGLTAEALLADTELLTTILTYHVVEGTVTSDMLSEGAVTTLQGEPVTISLSDGVMVNDATVTVADIEASNGVIHVIDSVLVPPSLLKQMQMGEVAANLTGDATYEGDFSFDYSSLFTLEEGTDIVRLTYEGTTIVVSGPDNYGLVLSSSTFDTAAEELGFVMDRLGYTVGDTLENTLDNALATVAVELPRRDQSGTATLLDLGFGRVGVVIAIATADYAPIAESGGDVVAASLTYPPNIVDIASSDDTFSTLVAAVDAAGLVGTLSGGEYTVFAPTNAAFEAALAELGLTAEALLADTELLTTILTYHVVEGTVTSGMLEAGDVTTLQGEPVTISLNGAVMVNDALVVVPDIEASNGVVHVIDSVLLPPSLVQQLEIAETAANLTGDATYEGDFSFDYSSLFTLEEGTDIVRLTYEGATIVVSGPDNYGLVLSSSTFDTAAEELGFVMDRLGYTVGDTLENTLDNALATVAVELPRRDQSGTATLLDLGFGRVGVVIAIATADYAPIAESGGDVVAASLTYPPTIVDIASSDDTFSTLVAAVDAAGLVGTLSGGEYTVFAPTNAAFEAALAELGLTAEALLADTELLTTILTYHVVEGTVTSGMLEAGDVTTLFGEPVTISLNGAVMVNDALVVVPDIEASNGVVHVIDSVLVPSYLTLTADARYTNDDFSFLYPMGFTANPGTDFVRLDRNGQAIVVTGPSNYGAVIATQTFESRADELAFALDRLGYSVGEAIDSDALAAVNVELPRRDQTGTATLLDVGNGNVMVVIALSTRPDDLTVARAAEIITETLRYRSTIVDVAAGNDDFSTLVAAVQAAGLADTLATEEVTVFAPTNAAFEAAFEALGITAEDLLADTETLTAILTYHVLSEPVNAADLFSLAGRAVPTLSGSTLQIDNVGGTVVLNGSVSVTRSNIPADNGIIHAIDGVLLPPGVGGGQCTISTTANDVLVRVGPGFNRTQIVFLPADQDFTVLSSFVDDAGNVWYELDEALAAPGKLITEAWVLSTDVTGVGACR